LPLIREQTLVIAGFDDPVVPLANATIMHQLLPHRRCTRTPADTST